MPTHCEFPYGDKLLIPLNTHAIASLARSLLFSRLFAGTLPVRKSDRADEDQIEIARLEDAINRYLTRNPLAADTVEGICSWWLAESGIHATRETVTTALEKMVRSGLIEKSDLHDGREIYALAQRKH